VPPQQPTGIGSLIGSIFGNSDTQAPIAVNVPEPEPRPAKRAAHARPATRPAATQTAAAKAKPHESRPAAKPQVAAGNRPVKQAAPQPEIRTAYSGPAPTPVNGMLTGAQPVLPAGSFEARWSAIH
jgi:hypothetical protein